MPRVTLQISFAPPDAQFASLVLPHQLRTWARQVDEIGLILDLRRPRGAQFGAEWDLHVSAMRDILAAACTECPHARLVEVDYAPMGREAVAATFFAGQPVPFKDFRGGPFYSYFYGLHVALHDHVLHLDSDMMFGGASGHWLTEALGFLSRDPDTLIVSPHPGPPLATMELGPHSDYRHRKLAAGTYEFHHITTRVFLIDRQRLVERLCPLIPERHPGLRMRLGALRVRRSTHELPEVILSRAMVRAGMRRVDMLGAPPGMWTLHPVAHDERYRRALTRLITRVENNELTPEQLGEYNLHDTMLVS